MLNFSEFLLEKAGDALQSNISNIKTRGHVKRYVLPYLSSEQKKQSIKKLPFFNNKDKEESDLENHGSSYKPDAEFTHTLASKFGKLEKNTPVKVTGVYTDGKTVMANTEKHGNMPISKLAKSADLAAASKTEEGVKLERILQKNIDPRFKPAGTTGGAWDYVAGDPNDENSVKGKAVKKDETAPVFRGESKGSKKGTVAMGTISISYNPKKRSWEYAKGKSKMQPKFEEAVHPDSGLPIIDHLNKYHSDGNLNKSFTTNAPAGTSRYYLEGLGANSLHLHRYKKDANGNYLINHGTTYTVGNDNPFQNKLGMAHLSNDDLDKLDGKLTVEPSGEGKVQIKHRPKSGVFNEYANRSKNEPDKHLDLSRQEHGELFRKNFNTYFQQLTKSKLQPDMSSHTSGEFGGVPFHSNDEKQL